MTIGSIYWCRLPMIVHVNVYKLDSGALDYGCQYFSRDYAERSLNESSGKLVYRIRVIPHAPHPLNFAMLGNPRR